MPRLRLHHWLVLVLAVVVVPLVVIQWTRPPGSGVTATPTVVASSTTPTPTVSLMSAVPQHARALFVGDSYSFGEGATDRTHSWPLRTAHLLGWRPTVEAVSGTGYTNGGRQDFPSRLQRRVKTLHPAPQVVVLEGSQNDYAASSEALTKAVVRTIGLATHAWPHATVIVFGPVAPQPLDQRLTPIRAADKAAAHRAGVPYVDPTGWITTGNTKRFAYGDAHLDDAGYAYLAKRFVAALRSTRVPAT